MKPGSTPGGGGVHPRLGEAGESSQTPGPQVGFLRALEQAGAGRGQDEARVRCPAVRGGSQH